MQRAAPLADRAIAVDHRLERAFDFKFDLAAVATADMGHDKAPVVFNFMLIGMIRRARFI